MPNPLPKPLADGSTVWRVRFVNKGRSSSETFTDQKRAKWFCAQIATHGVAFALKSLDDLEVARGERDLDGETPTLDEVAKDFFEWKAPRMDSALAADSYRSHYRAHISPTFGDRPVGTITPTDVSAWVDKMVAGTIANQRTGKALSAKTMRDRHALLHQILGWAADPSRRIIDANPCTAKAQLPKRVKPSPKGLMPTQWQALHAGFLMIGSQDGADLAAFLVGPGWRIGEAIALPVAGVEDYGPGRPDVGHDDAGGSARSGQDGHRQGHRQDAERDAAHQARRGNGRGRAAQLRRQEA